MVECAAWPWLTVSKCLSAVWHLLKCSVLLAVLNDTLIALFLLAAVEFTMVNQQQPSMKQAMKLAFLNDRGFHNGCVWRTLCNAGMALTAPLAGVLVLTPFELREIFGIIFI